MKRGFLLMAVSFMAMTSAFASLKDAYQITATSAAAKAGRQVTLSLNLKNKEAIASWQCELVLPAGVKVASVAPAVSSRCPEGYALTVTPKADAEGTYTVSCASTGDATITGTDGEVATITLYVERATATGTVSVKINNAKMFEANATSHEYATNEYAMTIAACDYLVGDINADNTTDGTDIVTLVNIVSGTDPKDFVVADVNEDGVIDGTDVVALVNIATGSAGN